jgi:sulfur-oxidizing protein SoxZ
MDFMASALITMPASAKSGSSVEVRALVGHPMETGFRPGADGRVIPANLIRKFSCTFDDGKTKETVFSTELFAAISANPYFSFHLKASVSGTLSFKWEGDNGFSQTETKTLTVT